MNLVSMTDFVLKVVQTPNVNEAICWEQTESRLNKIYQYALFLKRPLTLGMFVPCDLERNILEDPIPFDCTDKEYSEWCKAQERVLFKNVSIKEHGRVVVLDYRGREITIANTKIGVMPMMIIEDLVIHGFELTNNYANRI